MQNRQIGCCRRACIRFAGFSYKLKYAQIQAGGQQLQRPDSGQAVALFVQSRSKQANAHAAGMQKPFVQEEELKSKLARLDELNILLNMDKKENEIVGGEPDEGESTEKRKEKSYER